MKEYTVTKEDEGRRLDKYVSHILKNAPSSFTYKMLRKKNIVLNEKKASGNELLCAGDVVRFYLSDETFEKFSSSGAITASDQPIPDLPIPDIIYEDDDMIIVCKPSGMLTQRSVSSDISLNEICLAYAGKSAGDTAFTPSVCNRLDRNTSGLVTFAKTYRAARCLTAAFKDRSVKKYYKCVVSGVIDHDLNLKGYLKKDSAENKVVISAKDNGGSFINTVVNPIKSDNGLTLCEVDLVTGKTHQIRAHLAYEKHPILGDPKYGDRKLNDIYRQKYGITSQMLSCYRMVFPEDFELAAAGMTIETDIPEEFTKVI